MANISNLEIFGAGTHRAMTGTVTIAEKDLDEIVSAFEAFKDTNIVKPHLKLGHTESQKWFGQKDGIPSLGWIDRVWRAGKKLYADISNVPEALIELIRQGRYHNVSAELIPGAKKGDQQFKYALSAVSLLGVEMPAVKDLAGLASALFIEGPTHQFSEKDTLTLEAEKEKLSMFTQEQVDSLVAAAVAKANSETEAKFSAEIDNLKTELGVVKKAKDGLVSELDTVKANAAKAEAIAIVDGAIKEGKLLPKQRDFALAFMTMNDAKLKFGEGEKTASALFKEFLDANGKVIDTSEKGSGKSKKVEFSNAADEVDVKARELVNADASGKLQYAEAFQKVLASEPELRQRYADMSN